MVVGTTLNESPIVRVRWAWLALLAVQLVLVVVFLAGTVIATHRKRVQILKNSTVATLFALNDGMKDGLGPARNVGELSSMVEGIRVKLNPDGSLRLVDAGNVK